MLLKYKHQSIKLHFAIINQIANVANQSTKYTELVCAYLTSM